MLKYYTKIDEMDMKLDSMRADIETNRMYTWSDMSKVKENLWNKLHSIKSSVKEGATNLAQLVQRKTHELARQLP